MGEEPDHFKIYLEVIMEVNKNKKNIFVSWVLWFGVRQWILLPPIFFKTDSPLEKSALLKIKWGRISLSLSGICMNFAYSCKLNSTRTTLIEKI